jgi:CMP-N,N'-diacetyllegionaminic acid synthase
MPESGGTIGIIVGRGGSKRLPGKMLLPVMGHPLIAYTVRTARASRLDRVILSTDDEGIAETGRRYGAETPFRRPDYLAADFVTNDMVMRHALNWIAEHEGRHYDIAVLLQPTVPFLWPEDIDRCLDEMTNSDSNCCFTATEVSQRPEWMFTRQPDGSVDLLIGGSLTNDRQHTQKLADLVIPNGGAWAVHAEALRQGAHIYTPPFRIVSVPAERSVDIDEEIDLMIAEAVGLKHSFSITPERAKGETQ